MGAEEILQALQKGSAADTRTRYDFNVPEEARQKPDDPRKITVVGLTISEELDASKVSEAKGGSMAHELVRRAVVEIDDRPIDWSKNEDGWLERVSPTVREAAILAYRNVNEMSAEVKKSFLDSRKARV